MLLQDAVDVLLVSNECCLLRVIVHTQPAVVAERWRGGAHLARKAELQPVKLWWLYKQNKQITSERERMRSHRCQM
jgi:hypothetical protein